MLVLVAIILEKMVLCWHVVALVPISLPSAENWESWFNLEGNMVILALSVTGAYISNIVVVVETVNILWKVNSEAVDSVLSVIWVNVWHVVDSRELSIDTSSLVNNLVVFVD